ncbi:MAG: hypothetical protein OEZ14_03740 [Acidimicrobiia bacterium]|nr:hypothetical protein [Acidimicrobiia bacterium]
MTLHYVADLKPVMRLIHDVLALGGRFVMGVVHPVVTSHEDDHNGPRTTWTVDNYFDAGPRERRWLGATVTWYHRTIENYVEALLEAGFKLVAPRKRSRWLTCSVVPETSWNAGACPAVSRAPRRPLSTTACSLIIRPGRRAAAHPNGELSRA